MNIPEASKIVMIDKIKRKVPFHNKRQSTEFKFYKPKNTDSWYYCLQVETKEGKTSIAGGTDSDFIELLTQYYK